MVTLFRCSKRRWRPALLSGALLLLTATTPALAQLADTPWPMFHHDPRHSGQSTLLGPLFPTGAPAVGDVKFWQGFNKIKNSPSIGPDGTIYVAVDPRPEGPAHHGYLCAIKPDLTSEKWCAMFRADASPSSAAIGQDGTIYIG